MTEETSRFLGIDGGATKTAGVLCDPQGRVVSQATGKASNYHVVGLDAMQAHISQVIDDLLAQAEASKTDVAAWGIGLAGVDRAADRERVLPLLQELGVTDLITLTNDGMAALIGATAGEPGIVVIAGTGSIAFGLNAAGESCRVGGWGYLLGDEGSAYDIGRKGLVAALWAYDKRGPDTALIDCATRHFQLTAIPDLIQRVYIPKISATDIADFAREVARCAEDGDQVAREILIGAGQVLAQSALTIHERLDMGNGVIPVAMAGSVLAHNEIVQDAFKVKLAANVPAAEAIYPRREAAVGAALVAIQTWREANS